MTQSLEIGEASDRPLREEKSFDWQRFLEGPREVASIAKRQIRIVDLFSSIGGLTLGASIALQEEGLAPKPVFAADTDRQALSVYSQNWPGAHAHHGSVQQLVDSQVVGAGESSRFAFQPTILEENLASLKRSVDLIVAGPPCQGNSTLNNYTRSDDPRNALYLQVPAIASALEVPMVIIENVPSVVREKNNVVGTAANLFEQKGYFTQSFVLAGESFGWAQARKRFFLLASKHGFPAGLQDLLQTYGDSGKPPTWAWRNLPLKESFPLLSAVAELYPENVERAKFLHDNNLFDLPLELRPDSHKGGTTYTASYGRMHLDRPAPTLTGGLFSPGRGRFIHPLEPRTLTPREGLRLQGFPDWYDLNPNGKTSRTNLAKWIGDAVPPIMGYLSTRALRI